ncbi:hypothetical protein [Mucisphaera calidilacus]|uniref:hypothetical protein n=1 Tax=Mucisphaera calidilacus TaxID=2527982 RepID=UPI0011A69CBF|nr:hypothetical protein [Mucisphaera calidilacus]
MAPYALAREQVLVNPKRLEQLFDFEERNEQGVKIGASYAMPKYWYAIGRDPMNPNATFRNQPVHAELIARRGYPSFNKVGFDDTHRSSGDYALHLALDGGNAGAYLQVGALPVLPRSDYMITARVRTEDVTRAAGRIRAYFLDKKGNRIPGSERSTEPLDAEGNWVWASVKLIGIYPDAAWIGLEIELLQPEPSPENPLGNQQIVLEDLDAQMWIDDIGVWLLPHVEIGTQYDTNLIVAPEEPVIEANVRDLTGQMLRVEIGVFDHDRRRVDRGTWLLGDGTSDRWSWQPELPGYGWYLLEMSVFEVDQGGGIGRNPLARSVSALGYLPPRRPRISSDLDRFTLVAEGVTTHERDLIPEILDQTGLRSVILSVWQPGTTLESLNREQHELEALLRRIMARNRLVGLSFSPLPSALALVPGVETNSPMAMLLTDANLWDPYVAPVMLRHGQRIRDWHLGLLESDEPFFVDRLAGMAREIELKLGKLSPSPRIHLPWRLDQQRRDDMPSDVGYAIDVPESINAGTLERYLEAWRSPPLEHSLHLLEPDAELYPHRQRLSSLVRRMVVGWIVSESGVSLPKPWTAGFERRDSLLPDPLLPAFANVAQQLAERRYVTRLNLGGQRHAKVLDGDPGSLMVLWDVEDRRDTLAMYLGPNPTVTDIWGNTTSVERVGRQHLLTLGELPIFVQGIDVDLARLRASFTIDDDFIPSRQIVHRREISLTNPFPVTMQGRLRFIGPPEWRIQPRQHDFILDSGATMRLPIGMSFPIQEVSGLKQLTARATFAAGRNYDIDLTLPLELGLKEIQLSSSLSLVAGEEGAIDAVAIMVVTNLSEFPQSLYGFASMRGRQSKERIIASLNPGQSVIERFRFNDVGGDIQSTPIRVGIREARGPSMLTRLLRFDDAHSGSR